MKELTLKFQKAFTQGLRPDVVTLGSDWLYECHNQQPTVLGTKPIDIITNINDILTSLITTDSGVQITDDMGTYNLRR